MNDNKSLKILQWVIGVLVLCNIGLVLTIWLKPGRPPGPPPGGGATPREYLIHALDFSPGQVTQYDALIRKHQEDMRRLRRRANEYRHMLFEYVGDTTAGNTVDSLSGLIANTQKAIIMATYRHFTQVRALCTDEQKKKFDSIIDNVLQRMNNRLPPRPQRGGRMPPPPPGQGGL